MKRSANQFMIFDYRCLEKSPPQEGTSVHRNNNFQSFGQSLLVLFRSATGEPRPATGGGFAQSTPGAAVVVPAAAGAPP